MSKTCQATSRHSVLTAGIACKRLTWAWHGSFRVLEGIRLENSKVKKIRVARGETQEEVRKAKLHSACEVMLRSFDFELV